jgi:SAM-dependent methyltransferase
LANSVYLDNTELKRLEVQRQLLIEYEQPIYNEIINKRTGLTLLDLGCNDGSKTKTRFSENNFDKIIGLDCLDELTEKANKKFGNEVFKFFSCDVTKSDFIDKLTNIMSTEKIEYFNIINCSFLLIHLKNAVKVLKELKRFLAPDGCIIVIEPDDTESYLSPDTDGIFKEFLKVLEYDPYSGKRTFGSELPQLFNESGYLDYRLRCSTICAKGDEISKKEAIFTTFCSYLKEDLILLREQEPENNIYQECWEWVTRNFDKLHNYMISEKAKVCMGVKIYTCGGMANEHRRIDTNSIDT